MFAKHCSAKRADDQSVQQREKFPVQWASGGGLAKRSMAGLLFVIMTLFIPSVQAESYSLAKEWGTLPYSDNDQFGFPTSVAVDASGNVYVTDTGNLRIQKFNNNGTYLATWNNVNNNSVMNDSLDCCGLEMDFSTYLKMTVNGNNVYAVDASFIMKLDIAGYLQDAWSKYNPLWSIGYPVSIGYSFATPSEGPGTGYALSGGTSLYQFKCLYEVTKTDNYCVLDLAADNTNIYMIATTETEGGYLTILKYDLAMNLIKSVPTNIEAEFRAGVAVSNGHVYVAGYNTVQKFDSNLLTYKSTITTLKDGGGDVAVDSSGNVYVVDTGNNRIQKFTNGGTIVSTWGSKGSNDGQFSQPWSIAVDNNSNVYVADTDNNRIQKFNSNGVFLKKWGEPLKSEQSLSLEDVFKYDVGDHRYKSLNVDGTVTFTRTVFNGSTWETDDSFSLSYPRSGNQTDYWGAKTSRDGWYAYRVVDIAESSNGNIYILNRVDIAYQGETNYHNVDFVSVFDSNGIRQGSFEVADSISNGSIAVDSVGNVYVAIIQNDEVDEIKKFNSTGTYLSSLPLPQFIHPISITVDNKDNVYVVNANELFGILKFDSTGNLVTTIGGIEYSGYDSKGRLITKIGDVEFPRDVAVDSDGNVYVTSVTSPYVQTHSSTKKYLIHKFTPLTIDNIDNRACITGRGEGKPYSWMLKNTMNTYNNTNITTPVGSNADVATQLSNDMRVYDVAIQNEGGGCISIGNYTLW